MIIMQWEKQPDHIFSFCLQFYLKEMLSSVITSNSYAFPHSIENCLIQQLGLALAILGGLWLLQTGFWWPFSWKVDFHCLSLAPCSPTTSIGMLTEKEVGRDKGSNLVLFIETEWKEFPEKAEDIFKLVFLPAKGLMCWNFHGPSSCA